MDFRSLSDEQLAEHAQAGTQLAFNILAERYWERLLRYVRRLLPASSDAEDIVQNALIKAYVNLKSFNPDRRFSPWVYRIAHNALVDHVKSLKHDAFPFFDPDVLFPHPISPDRPDEDAEVASIRALLDDHLQELPPHYREPLVLRYVEGLSYRDIADVLHVPVGTVSIRLKRALDILRKTVPNELT